MQRILNTMEIFFARFSHLTETIFDQLDKANLTKCREVSRQWQQYLDEKRFLQIRVIRSVIGNVGKPWEIFFKASNTESIQQIRYAVERLYSSCLEWRRDIITQLCLDESLTPLHVAAWGGHMAICKLFMENLADKFPKNENGQTPLHFAAWSGHLAVCKLFMENLAGKFPKNENGEPPLHLAAKEGFLNTCGRMVKPEDINPIDNMGVTPLHLAAQCGHFNVCEYILKNVVTKNPENKRGLIPYDYARFTPGVSSDVIELLHSKLAQENHFYLEASPLDYFHANEGTLYMRK